jgi:hypothetical protein
MKNAAKNITANDAPEHGYLIEDAANVERWLMFDDTARQNNV